ncbi:MAG: hypothetical protein OXB93_05000 [Cytophagales bacterium]|nr:hypothetical protein [Cytophagales bacterium]
MEIFVDIALYLTYVLCVATAVVGIFFPIVIAFKQGPATLKKLGIGVLILGIIFVVSYFLSGNEVLPSYEKYGVGAAASQTIGGVLVTMYVLILSCITGIAATEVLRWFK